MPNIKLKCGCQFDAEMDADNRIISMHIPLDIEEINLQCSNTWDLICAGNTVGVFQLESHLGRSLSEEFKPRNIEELAALISIMRPGCLDSKLEDGKSLTQHFIMRKHGKEAVEYIHPKLEPILKNTYSILVYQEQSIKIGEIIGGMNLAECDYFLRSGIGKKQIDVIQEGKKIFLERATVDKKTAEQIFEWIEASSRYQFNKSHAIAYAIDGYKTAYLKYHFPRAFFVARLSNAKDKKEIAHFVKDAKKNGVIVLKPDIRTKNMDFALIDKKIRFGLSKIKDVGESHFKKIDTIDIPQTWIEFLVNHANILGKSATSSLIKAGALDFYKETRNKMLFQHRQFIRLNDNQANFLKTSTKDSLEERLLEMINIGYGKKMPCGSLIAWNNAKKIYELLMKPNIPLTDSVNQIIEMEKDFIGYPLTYDELYGRDTSAANMTCADVLLSKKRDNINICVVINDIKEIITKNNEKMCFLRVSDDMGSLDSIVIFPEIWKNHNAKLFVGNTITINCYRKDKSLIAKNIWQI